MLLIKFNRDTILKPLTQVMAFVEKKQTMPILANVYIKKTDKKILFVASDAEIQITLCIEDVLDSEDFVLTLPAKKLQDILKAMPESEITLEINESKVTVKYGKTKFIIHNVSADSYPLMKIQQDCIAQFSLSQANLKDLLGKVQYAMAVNDSRVFLNGMLIEVKDNQLNFVATDAHRLGFASFALADLVPDISVILPRKTVLEFFRLLEHNEDIITIKMYPNQIIFEGINKQLISKVIDGKYPDYNRVIPLNNDKLCLLNREELLRVVQRVSVIGIDKLKTITVELKPNLLTVGCQNEDREYSQDEINVQYGYEEELKLNFNITYILDVLANNEAENLQWAFFDNQRSVLVTVPNEIDFKYVIMPLRT